MEQARSGRIWVDREGSATQHPGKESLVRPTTQRRWLLNFEFHSDPTEWVFQRLDGLAVGAGRSEVASGPPLHADDEQDRAGPDDRRPIAPVLWQGNQRQRDRAVVVASVGRPRSDVPLVRRGGLERLPPINERGTRPRGEQHQLTPLELDGQVLDEHRLRLLGERVARPGGTPASRRAHCRPEGNFPREVANPIMGLTRSDH